METPIGTTVGMENFESGMSLVGTLEAPAALVTTASNVSCTVMEHFQTTDDIKHSVHHEEAFLDSDDSEMKIRRQRRRMKMADPLKQLVKSEFEDLLDYLEHETPQSVHILSFIKIMLKWKDNKELKRRGLKYKILVNRDECGEEYSVIIAYYTWEGEVKGSVYAPSHSGEQTFREALQYSKYLPVQSAGCEWSLFPRGVASDFMDHWRQKHDDGGYGPQYTAYPIHLYWVQKGIVDSINFEVPRDIKVYELQEKHLRVINHYWSRHYEGSELLIAQIFESNITAGAFTYTNCLVGWAFQTHCGSIEIPFTLSKYRERGIGRSVLLTLAQSLAKENFDPHIFIYKDDHKMKAFLVNSGFTFVDEMHYFYVSPPQKDQDFQFYPGLTGAKSLIT